MQIHNHIHNETTRYDNAVPKQLASYRYGTYSYTYTAIAYIDNMLEHEKCVDTTRQVLVCMCVYKSCDLFTMRGQAIAHGAAAAAAAIVVHSRTVTTHKLKKMFLI